MPESLKETADVLTLLWSSWGNAEHFRQLHRMCAGWTNAELIPLARQLADAGEIKRVADIVRSLRLAALRRFGDQASGPAHKTSEWTEEDALCEAYRRKWGSEYTHYTNDEMLALIEQSLFQADCKLYGRVRPHVAFDSKRFVKQCHCTSMMTYGAHDCDRHGTSGSDYMNQDRYWRCDRCGATERVTKPLTKPEPKPEGEPHATSCR